MTKAFVLGNLSRNPDYKTTSNGTSVCELCVAANGRRPDDVSFIDVTVYGKHAENCRQCLVKGSRVMVEGHIRQDRYEDRNGKKVYKTYIVADEVIFLSPKENSGRPEYDQPPQRY